MYGSREFANFGDENYLSDDDSMDFNHASSDLDAGSNSEGVKFDKQGVVRSMAELVCSSDFPLQAFDSIHFRKFLKVANPLFKPNMEMVGSECMEIYKKRRAETEDFLRNFDGRISLSVDILSHGTESYLCLSAHFVDENWKLKKWVLNFQSLRCFGTEGEEVVFFKLLEEWGIENKISNLTWKTECDWEACDLLVEFVKSRIQDKKELQLNGKLFRVDCCGDVIKTMAQGAFSKIQDIIDEVCELYSFGRSLPLWHLTSHNLKEALELWYMGEFSSQDVIDHYDVPSREEWKKVEGVCKITEKMYEVANALFETKNLTANVYLYHLDELREFLTQNFTDSDDFVRTLAKGLLRKFNKYWDDMFLLLAISAALDPRFKMNYIEFVCSKANGEAGNSQVPVVLGAINKLFDEYVIGFPERENFVRQSSSDSDSDSEGETPRANTAKHTFIVMQNYQHFLQLSDQPGKKSDLDRYLEEPVLPWSQDFDALTWWSTAGSKYPTLSRMARDFLAIPVSVASSFGAFYTQRRPADKRVVCLKPELMNALVCTRSWCADC